MSLRRSMVAVCPLAAVLGFVACGEHEDSALSGAAVVAPSATPTQNPDGTATKHLCKVTKRGDASKVIAGTLLLPEGPADGELFIDANGVIACAGASCSSAAGYDAATKIACTDVVVSPGLINAHDHISFANNPPPRPASERYEHRHDWRKGLRGHTVIRTNAPTVRNAVAAAELRFIMSGLTSTASGGSAGSGAPGLARNIDSNTRQLEGLPVKLAVSDTFPLNDSSGTLAKTCNRFPSNRKKTTDIANTKAYLPHVAEGVDDEAHAEFLCQSNTFPGVSDPTHDLIQRQTAVIHGVAVNPGDIRQYRDDLAILVWSPRSNISLYGNTAPIAEYAHLGVPIALGTDWLPSGSMNVARELKCADDLNRKYFDRALTDRQLWQSVTVHAAYATGTADTIGQLKAGLVADVALFDATQARGYRAVIEAGVEDTILVLRGGKTMYGDSELVSEIGDGDCEDLAVCKFTKKACVRKDAAAGVTLADLQTAANAVYPLFYCKGETPKNEPSCEPARGATASDDQASVYDGITAGDKDGDGVADADDNCPSVFNPIRPMDHGAQGDVDGDGIGDACDRCPFDAGESCTPPDADDMDGDGVPNASDPCPEDPDPACGASPGGVAPVTLSIADIRDPSSPRHPTPGSSRPSIKGVVVTAVKTGTTGLGFFVQDATATELGGLFVFTGSAQPGVKVGNEVDVEGDYIEFDGTSELTNPKVTVVDAGTTLAIAPIAVPADYDGSGGEKLEGMLCAIDGPVAVTDANPDAPLDFDELVVTGGVRVDDFVWRELDNTFPVGTTFAKVVGICHWSHGNRKIYPRFDADLPRQP
ncbi:MAG: amidohydrolase family protein [Labilithrix sp.]|nr:amidohydrolase family protein [Labilithrix sp.]MCW5809760.1 amidohydrolase family protein [Labilithrix sp.]